LFLRDFEPQEKTESPAELERNILLNDVLAELTKSKTLRDTTIYGYGIAVKQFVAVAGNKYIDQYTHSDLEAFKAHLLSRKISAVTINIWLRSLIAIGGHAVKRNLIATNPFSKYPLFKIPQAPPTYLSGEQFQRVLKAARTETHKDIFQIAVYTGMRLGEIVSLRWQSISLEKKQIAIVNTPDFTTKTGKGRLIPMNDTVVEIMQKRFKNRKKSEHVFCTGWGRKFSRDYMSRQFKNSVVKAGLDESFHFHSLRHTFASWLALKEVPIFSIQQLLGHSSVNTTLVYAHLSSSILHSAVNKL
jgi:site-specific recombinase XerD